MLSLDVFLINMRGCEPVSNEGIHKVEPQLVGRNGHAFRKKRHKQEHREMQLYCQGDDLLGFFHTFGVT